MRDRKVASRYARALLIAAREAGQVEEIAESYESLRATLRGNVDLATFLESPQVADREKHDLLRALLTGRVEPLLVNFVQLLLDKGRIFSFGDICEEYQLLVETEQGYKRAVVTTAVKLPDDLEQRLVDKLASLTGSKIILEKKVDPRVIGGARVILGDRVVDGTVHTNLERVRKQLGEAPLRLSE
jgi:F-type H+-transporting ATPase subunit delta